MIGSSGFMQLVNAFINNKSIPLHDLHLAGNNITANQISYLINQLKLDSIRHSHSSQTSSPFIFPFLTVLNLNGRQINMILLFLLCFLDNPLGNNGVKLLFRFLNQKSFPQLREVCLFSTY